MSVTMTRNEADLIELFVRYHSPLVTRMIILDNGSSDGTREVLSRLQNEGLSLHVIYDDRPSFDQAEIITALVQLAIERFGPAFVLPLDVDEFLCSPGHAMAPTWYEGLSDQDVGLLQWMTYIPLDNVPWGAHILRTITCRREVELSHEHKVLIPRSVGIVPSLSVSQGSHRVEFADGKRPRHEIVPGLRLAHFPVRSAEQARKKYLIGWLANLARTEAVVFDWYTYYNQLKLRPHPVQELLADMAGLYNITDKRVRGAVVEDPLDLSHVGDLRIQYPLECRDAAICILDYAESLAVAFSKTRSAGQATWEQRVRDQYDDQLALNAIRDFLTIPGWLSSREALGLYRSVLSLESAHPNVVELGTFEGRSAFVLARAILEVGAGQVHCIDPFDRRGEVGFSKYYPESNVKTPGLRQKSVADRMQQLGVGAAIRLHIGTSKDVVCTWCEPIDLLYIDADHEYEQVLEDFRAWSRHLRTGGLIAFHDVGSSQHTGPKQVVEEHLVHSQDWTQVLFVDELFVARKN